MFSFLLAIFMEYWIFHQLLFELFSNLPPSPTLWSNGKLFLSANNHCLLFKLLCTSGQLKYTSLLLLCLFLVPAWKNCSPSKYTIFCYINYLWCYFQSVLESCIWSVLSGSHKIYLADWMPQTFVGQDWISTTIRTKCFHLCFYTLQMTAWNENNLKL